MRIGRRSENVEDRRGMSVGRGVAGLGGGGLLLVLLISVLTGTNPMDILSGGGGGTAIQVPQGGAPAERSERENQLADFASGVLADTEDTWNVLFEGMGRTYRAPTLVLFTGAVESACGFAQSAVGPFYCPQDEKVYLDLGFFDELSSRLGAPGDFAQAYVIAHEIGHHVQRQLGIMEQVDAQRASMSEEDAAALSVRLELQADFLAGVWAHHAQSARQVLEQGDVEEALNAASQIGDDRLQMQAQGYVVPESFTHGSAEQRVRWFRRGFETGDISQGDTFDAPTL